MPPEDPVAAGLVGRERELAEVRRVLDRDGASSALVVGEPGIGKTTLWRAAVDEARARGLRVLLARPAEAEAALAFAALDDLLGDVVDAAGALPSPQRRALRAALLLEDAPPPSVDPRTLAVGLLGLLRLLAADGRVLVAIDDVQWVDRATGDALGYALRRLDADDVVFLGTARPGGTLPVAVVRRRIELAGVDPTSIGEIVQRELGVRLPRPVVRRLHSAAGGNPFYSLELARALVRRGPQPPIADRLPIPSDLRELMRERLSVLGPATREALAAAAALGHPERASVAAAAPRADLEAAERAGVIEAGAVVRFTHPLLASVAYADLESDARRALHRRLAAVAPDGEERARHLALAAANPDESVAAALDAAAAGARARGASDAAAELAELALGLTPPADGEARLRRSLTAADHAFGAGAPARAAELVERELATARGAQRARLLLELARYRTEIEGVAAARPLLLEARAAAAGDDGLLARVHSALAWNANASIALAEAYEHAQRGLEHAHRCGVAQLRAEALAQAAFFRFTTGGGLARADLETAVALDATPDAGLSPTFIGAVLLLWAGETEGACATFAELERRAAARGDVAVLQLRTWLAVGDLRAGRWADAIARLRAVRAAEDELGFTADRSFLAALEAVAHAYLGDEAAVDELTTVALEPPASPQAQMDAFAAKGFLRLSQGDAHSADELLRRGAALARGHGIVDPGVFVFAPDEIEAAILVGDLARAGELLADFEERARRVGRRWALATGARCRALLLDARGHAKDALAAADEALAHHERAPQPLDRARALLVRGSILRRARRLRAARESLDAAASAFDELGARVWAERARTELARLGGRAPRTSVLTPTERQVVELVVSGRSNHDVAVALHLSPKTVEWNLSKIYKKVGVASRTELAAKLARRRP